MLSTQFVKRWFQRRKDHAKEVSLEFIRQSYAICSLQEKNTGIHDRSRVSSRSKGTYLVHRATAPISEAMNAKGEFTMKRTQRMITFLVSACMLMTMGSSPNVAYASSSESGYPAPPKVATKEHTLTAARGRAPYLRSLADDWNEYDTLNRFVTVYDVYDLGANTVLWSWSWCTTTAQVLRENWEKISLSYEVDGYLVPLRNFRNWDFDDELEIPGRGTVQGKCRMTYGALYDWPTGDHELTVEAYFNADVNDGWELYPAGTLYRDVYRVKVLQNIDPVGIEYLGDANYACYYIQGSNGYQLSEQMDKLGPDLNEQDETWAMASSANDVSGGACYADGTADLSDLKVNLTNLITVPCWYPPAGTRLAEIAKFDDLMRHFARHELRHNEINNQYARILEQRLKNSNTCDDATWYAINNQTSEERKAAHDAFHASPEGQGVPYP